ncbi:PaaI family thioesterase [Nocardia iowensis]|uniref:PaaI family thioesterase n=2 Tax=Nocardia iowensis TaxID=204891 RepID=A0ABX8RG76_NOCIO|nr:PaaI family thioesterase [Nocardia iowensis]QXN88614.1 PaaI family thioesterase [Nocardia iowensis]
MSNSIAGDTTIVDHYPRCFGCGSNNPASMRIHAVRDGNRITADWLPPETAEGGPGLVHGGYLAAAVDEIQALLASSVAGVPAMTATMSIQYRKPVLLGRPLTLEAEVTEQRGRKLTLTMRALDNESGEACFEGSGLYIAVRSEVWMSQMDKGGKSFSGMDFSNGDLSTFFGWHVRSLRENYRGTAESDSVTARVEFANLQPAQWVFRLDGPELAIDPATGAEARVDIEIHSLGFNTWLAMLERPERAADLLAESGTRVHGEPGALTTFFAQLSSTETKVTE